MEDAITYLDAGVRMKEKAWHLCKHYLQGAWNSVQLDEMEFEEISGGLSNMMYYCGLPGRIKPKGREPSEVLLRIFGKTFTQLDDVSSIEAHCSNLVVESVIYTLLSERKLGPKLMGVFPGGRLEEFIPAKSLRSSQVRSKRFSDAIARKLAKFHQLSVPINKNPTWLFKNIAKWSSAIDKVEVGNIEDLRERQLAQKVLLTDFQSEIDWLMKAVERTNSAVVFCHNDLHGGNILVRDHALESHGPVDDSIVVIDYELCNYNYRAFDIANHLTEWIYDYTKKDYPYYHCEKDKFPSKEKQMQFLQVYLQQYLSGIEEPSSHCSNASPNAGCHRRVLKALTFEQQMQLLFKEVQTFVAVAAFTWALWSISQFVDTKITFGYWHYADVRLQQYFQNKHKIINDDVEHDFHVGKRTHED